jgi:hypothetical protein
MASSDLENRHRRWRGDVKVVAVQVNADRRHHLSAMGDHPKPPRTLQTMSKKKRRGRASLGKMNEKEELAECLRLQNELDDKSDELVKRFKKVVEAHRHEHVIVDLDGTLYELREVKHDQEAIRFGRRHKGFWFDYRLEKLAKTIVVALAALVLFSSSALAGTFRVHYSIRGSGRDVTVQAQSSAEASRTVMDMFPGAVVTAVHKIR